MKFLKLDYILSVLLVFVGPLIIAYGLYSIKDKHYAVTNVCNETFYPDLCGKKEVKSES